MDTPTCRQCKTDRYLKVESRTYGSTEILNIRTASGVIRRRQRGDGVVQYFCQKCGKLDGHTVDDSWELGETASPEELRALGTWYGAPGERYEIMENGATRIVMGW